MIWSMLFLAALIKSSENQEIKEIDDKCKKDGSDHRCFMDGFTYPNTCIGRLMNMEASHYGKCRKYIKGDSKEIVNLCEDVSDPVCGMDGKEYRNSCFSLYQGKTRIAYPGKCIDVCKVCLSPLNNAYICGTKDGQENVYASSCYLACNKATMVQDGFCKNTLAERKKKNCYCKDDIQKESYCTSSNRIVNNACLVDCLRAFVESDEKKCKERLENDKKFS